MTSAPHVSVFLFLKDEANLALGQILSIQRAVDRLGKASATADVTVIVPQSSTATLAWLAERDFFPTVALPDDRIGSARRSAVERARGTHLAFIDGGTIWCGDFLVDALAADLRASAAVVWRPEFLITFPERFYQYDRYAFAVHPPRTGHDAASLLSGNPYPPTWLARTEILRRVPLPVEDRDRGWGDADRWWIANLLGAGVENAAVPGTFCYVPSRPGAEGPSEIGPTILECGRKRAERYGLLVTSDDA